MHSAIMCQELFVEMSKDDSLEIVGIGAAANGNTFLNYLCTKFYYS